MIKENDIWLGGFICFRIMNVFLKVFFLSRFIVFLNCSILKVFLGNIIFRE